MAFKAPRRNPPSIVPGPKGLGRMYSGPRPEKLSEDQMPAKVYCKDCRWYACCYCYSEHQREFTDSPVYGNVSKAFCKYAADRNTEFKCDEWNPKPPDLSVKYSPPKKKSGWSRLFNKRDEYCNSSS